MSIEPKTLELTAISISIAAGCIPCTRFHRREAEKEGAASIEIDEAVDAGARTANNALTSVWATFSERVEQPGTLSGEYRDDRQFLLSTLGAAAATNNVSLFNTFVRAARLHGIRDEHIMEIYGLATRIKEKAASHLTATIDRLDADAGIADEAARLCT